MQFVNLYKLHGGTETTYRKGVVNIKKQERIVWRCERRGKKAPKTVLVREHLRSKPIPIPDHYWQQLLFFEEVVAAVQAEKSENVSTT
jgi:hypothetical protein